MSETATPPESGTPAPPAPVQMFLRRVDIVDGQLDVLLSGPSFETLEPAVHPLEPAIAAEVRELIAHHDFTRIPVATSLVGTTIALRVVRSLGIDRWTYGVCSERLFLGKRLEAIASRYGLSGADVELLRLTIAGHVPAQIARRLQLSDDELVAADRSLREKVGVRRMRDLVSLVFDDQLPEYAADLSKLPIPG